MTGLYYLAIPTLCHEIGCPSEGALKALERLSEVGFCYYDDEHELVWVPKMAEIQIGESLSPKDNNVKHVQAQFDQMPETAFKRDFYRIYGERFHIKNSENWDSTLEAPLKPLRSQEQEQETEQEQDTPPKPPSSGGRKGASKNKSELSKPAMDAFNAFWERYPKRVARAAAERAWKKLVPDSTTSNAIQAALVNHLENWKILGTSQQYIPHGSTWLNNRQWEDEIDLEASRKSVAAPEKEYAPVGKQIDMSKYRTTDEEDIPH
jgi:hypothetical protein